MQHADAMHEFRRLALTIDPPPAVVLEIDITSTALHTLPLYAVLGVPEVWRSTRQGIHLYQRRGEGDEPSESSTVFPGVPRTDLDHFLAQSRAMTNRTAWCKAVVAWVQARDAPRPTP